MLFYHYMAFPGPENIEFFFAATGKYHNIQ